MRNTGAESEEKKLCGMTISIFINAQLYPWIKKFFTL